MRGLTSSVLFALIFSLGRGGSLGWCCEACGPNSGLHYASLPSLLAATRTSSDILVCGHHFTTVTVVLLCTSCHLKVYYSTDQADATSTLSRLFSPPFSPSLPSVAQTSLHPANVVKTLLQTKGSFAAILPLTWATLSRGAGAQFLLSLPNGALHFAVLEVGTLISLPVYTIAVIRQQCVEANY